MAYKKKPNLQTQKLDLNALSVTDPELALESAIKLLKGKNVKKVTEMVLSGAYKNQATIADELKMDRGYCNRIIHSKDVQFIIQLHTKIYFPMKLANIEEMLYNKAMTEQDTKAAEMWLRMKGQMTSGKSGIEITSNPDGKQVTRIIVEGL